MPTIYLIPNTMNASLRLLAAGLLFGVLTSPQAMPAAETSTNWHQIFSDDFSASNSVWRFELGYTLSNATAIANSYGKVEDGVLKLKANVACGWNYVASYAWPNIALPPRYALEYRFRKTQFCGWFEQQIVAGEPYADGFGEDPPWSPKVYCIKAAGTGFYGIQLCLQSNVDCTLISPTNTGFSYGPWYDVRVEGNTNSFKVWVNGALQNSYTGPFFTGGFPVFWTLQAGATAEVDDVKIYTDVSQLHVYPAVELEWQTSANVTYQIQSSTNMVDWTNQGPAITGHGLKTNLFDSARDAKRFYRLEVAP